MLRILLIGAVIYLAVRAITRVILGTFLKDAEKHFRFRSGPRPQTRTNGAAVEQLVKDPQCGVMLPKHQAITMRNKFGEEVCFCSQKCADAFTLADQSR